ncbi:thiocillin family RiPP [Kitasatospora sp. NPDC093558]|uniref:thiocillin family RiPP n=1 Tax=Kitasatospora sp. NPDC093558 TaxID=3155201 RepID=UPI0034172A47
MNNEQQLVQGDELAPFADDIAIEELSDATGGSFCLGTVGSAGCPSSAGSIGTASSH